jgi:tRNA threonylcarbamoyladenosine biosynthesis protein TsaB
VILALDTSTQQSSVALLDEKVVRSEWSWQSGGSASGQLHRVIAESMDLTAVSMDSLRGVVVARGPGSFSGVRVAISVAKGLAMGLGIPLVGISTLDVIGLQASAISDDVWAVLPAGRGQVYAAHFVGRGPGWRRDGDYRLLSAEELIPELPGAEVAGDGVELLFQNQRDHSSLRPVAFGPCALRRAAFLAELGRIYLQSGGRDQLDDLEPLYLRPSAAEEKRAANRQE